MFYFIKLEFIWPSYGHKIRTDPCSRVKSNIREYPLALGRYAVLTQSSRLMRWNLG